MKTKYSIAIILLLLANITATVFAAEKNQEQVMSQSNEVYLYMNPKNRMFTEAQKEIESICKENNSTMFLKQKDEVKWVCKKEDVLLIIVVNKKTQTSHKYEGWDLSIKDSLIASLKNNKKINLLEENI